MSPTACRVPRWWRPAGMMLAALFLVSCGRRGDPMPPGRRLPGPPSGVAVSGPAGLLTVSWGPPREDLAGRRLQGLGGYLVLRGAWAPGSAPCDTCPEDLSDAATLDLEERRARGQPETSWHDPAARPGWTYRYRVRALDDRMRPGPLSEAATLTWAAVPTPEAEAAPGDGQAFVRVRTPSWPPAVEPLGVRVYGPDGRRLAEAPPGLGEFVVPGLTNGVRITLSARLAGRTREGADVEGPGAELEVVPVDRTPPLPPSDVVGFAEARGASLRWLPSGPEPYAEILVLRTTEGGRFEEIARLPGKATSFADAGALPGRTYLYTVIALDAAGNQSLPARDARVRLPQAGEPGLP